MPDHDLIIIGLLGFAAPILGAICSRLGPLSYIRPGTSLALFGAGLAGAYWLVAAGGLLPITKTAGIMLIGLGTAVAFGVVRDAFNLYSLQEVRSGILVLAFSFGITVGLFVIVGFHRFTLENGATVLSCIFGISLALFLLYKAPEPTKRDSHSAARSVELKPLTTPAASSEGHIDSQDGDPAPEVRAAASGSIRPL